MQALLSAMAVPDRAVLFTEKGCLFSGSPILGSPSVTGSLFAILQKPSGTIRVRPPEAEQDHGQRRRRIFLSHYAAILNGLLSAEENKRQAEAIQCSHFSRSPARSLPAVDLQDYHHRREPVIILSKLEVSDVLVSENSNDGRHGRIASCSVPVGVLMLLLLSSACDWSTNGAETRGSDSRNRAALKQQMEREVELVQDRIDTTVYREDSAIPTKARGTERRLTDSAITESRILEERAEDTLTSQGRPTEDPNREPESPEISVVEEVFVERMSQQVGEIAQELKRDVIDASEAVARQGVAGGHPVNPEVVKSVALEKLAKIDRVTDEIEEARKVELGEIAASPRVPAVPARNFTNEELNETRARLGDIRNSVESALRREPRLARFSLRADVEPGAVRLRGVVENMSQGALAEQIAAEYGGSLRILNELRLVDPN